MISWVRLHFGPGCAWQREARAKGEPSTGRGKSWTWLKRPQGLAWAVAAWTCRRPGAGGARATLGLRGPGGSLTYTPLREWRKEERAGLSGSPTLLCVVECLIESNRVLIHPTSPR